MTSPRPWPHIYLEMNDSPSARVRRHTLYTCSEAKQCRHCRHTECHANTYVHSLLVHTGLPKARDKPPGIRWAAAVPCHVSQIPSRRFNEGVCSEIVIIGPVIYFSGPITLPDSRWEPIVRAPTSPSCPEGGHKSSEWAGKIAHYSATPTTPTTPATALPLHHRPHRTQHKQGDAVPGPPRPRRVGIVMVFAAVVLSRHSAG